MASKSNAGDAAKAYRLRRREKAGEALDPIDKLWLVNYTEKVEARDAKRGQRRPLSAGRDIGASRATRKITLDIDEEQESAGTGGAAAAAAVAALESREEGRRLDYLTVGAIDALREACSVYRDICVSLRERTETLEATHIAMLDGVREHYAARTEAEMALAQREALETNENPATAIMVQMIAQKLGLSPTGNPFARPPVGKGPHKGS
jgi:hypothetical protein